MSQFDTSWLDEPPGPAVLATPNGDGPTPHPPAAPPKLHFLTPAQLRERTPPEPTWLWQGYLAACTLTVLAGKPKVGKSTLAFAIAHASAADTPTFLDRSILGGAVVYVTEEAGPTLLPKLPADEPNLHILTRDGAWPKPTWTTLVAGAVEHADRIGARLLVIDTLSYWAGLPAERENDAGAVGEITRVLGSATSRGIGVLLCAHTRKSGGEDGDAIRGSSALAGAADTLLELERPGPNAPGRQRLLVALGRFPQTPGALLLDYDPTTGSWATHGEAASRQEGREAGDRATILATIAGETFGMTRRMLEDATGLAGQRVSAALGELTEHGELTREGDGKKGSPYRYLAVPPKAATDAAQTAGQKRAETAGVGVPFCAAPPKGQQKETPDEHDAAQQTALAETLPAARDDEGQAVDALRAAFDAEEVEGA